MKKSSYVEDFCIFKKSLATVTLNLGITTQRILFCPLEAVLRALLPYHGYPPCIKGVTHPSLVYYREVGANSVVLGGFLGSTS